MTYNSAQNTVRSGFTDFPFLYNAGARLNAGGHLYTRDLTHWFPPDQFNYPPIPALGARLLAILPEQNARQVWIGFMFVGMCLAIFFFAQGTEIRWHQPISLCLLLITEHRFIPTMWQFFFGQMEFLLLPIFAAMYWANKSGRSRTFAVLVAVAVMIKPWSAIAALWLVAERAWASLLLFFTLSILGLVTGFACVGWNEFPWFLRTTLKYANQPFIQSHSLPAFAQYLFQPGTVATAPLIKSDLLYYVARAAGSAVLLSPIPLLWRRPAKSCYEKHLRFSLILLSGFLLLPLFYTNYLVMILPVLWTAIIVTMGQQRPSIALFVVGTAIYLSLTLSIGDKSETKPLFLAIFRFLTLAGLWLTLFHVVFKISNLQASAESEKL